MHPPLLKPGRPLYKEKPDYGKVPHYLQRNKAKIVEEKARADAVLLAVEQVPQQALAMFADVPLPGSNILDRQPKA
jgi:hypothetical protein